MLELVENALDQTFYRYKSILPLPVRDGRKMYSTISDFLFFIKNNEPTINDFNEWVSDNFTNSKNFIYDSRKTLERANLLRVGTDGRLYLTKDVEKHIDSDQKLAIIVSKGFIEAYQGFLEFIVISAKYEGKSLRLIFEKWYEVYESSFDVVRSRKTSYSQFNTIKRYLISFGLIIYDKGKIIINDDMLKCVLEFENNL